jgi:hypothetical protein
MFKYAIASLVLFPVASFACDYARLARAGYGHDVAVVKVVRAAPSYDRVAAVADDYCDAGNVAVIRRVSDYGHNVAIVNAGYSHNVAIVNAGYGHDVQVVKVVRGRNVRAGNPNAGGGVLGILKAAAKTVGNVGRAVIGG